MPVTVIKEVADSILPMIARGLAMPTRSHVDRDVTVFADKS
jgi:hypothetical protein